MAGLQTIVLRKNEHTAVEELAPGEYVPYARGRDYGRSAWAGICCPECCKSLLLLRDVHTVDYDGVVTPGVNCPDDNCDLSGHVQLADWVPEARGNA